MTRHCLLRAKRPGPCLMEVAALLFFVLMLVFIYEYSEVAETGARIYTEIALEVPGAFENSTFLSADGAAVVVPPEIACSADELCGSGTDSVLLTGLSAGAYEYDADCVEANIDDVSSECRTAYRLFVANATANATTNGSVDVELEPGVVRKVIDLTEQLLAGPVPIPDFDQFVLVADYLTQNVDQDSKEAELIDRSEFGQRYSNIVNLGRLGIAPAGEAADAFVAYMEENHVAWGRVEHEVYGSEKEAVDYALDNLATRTWAVLVLDSVEPGSVDFTIRMNYTTVPNTHEIVNSANVGLYDQYEKYYLSGFLTLQRTLQDFARDQVRSAANASTACPAPGTPVLGIPFPTEAYDVNGFYESMEDVLGMILVVAALYPVARLLKSIVEDKEKRMRETLLILGLHESVYNVAWLAASITIFSAYALAVSCIVSSSFFGHSEPSLVFMFIWLLFMSVMAAAFMLSTFFSRSKVAGMAGVVILFAAIIPQYMFLDTNQYEAAGSKRVASLLSPTAFGLGTTILVQFENAAIGINWDNYDDGDYSFRTTLVFLFLDTVLYFLLAFYLDKTLPREYGSSLHPLFFLSARYWRGVAETTTAAVTPRVGSRRFSRGFPASASAAGDDAGPQGGGAAGLEVPRVRVKNLRFSYSASRDMPLWVERIFAPLRRAVRSRLLPTQASSESVAARSGRDCAVDGLSLDMMEGQVTVLLGHNGAGKSTTIGLLTGLFRPTSGAATIWDRDVAAHMSKIRQDMGVCPQHSVLDDDLTVREHLMLVSKLKGLRGEDAARKAAKEVGLLEKYHVRSAALSGGMKRKLSLSMALIGDPRFVLLDEPSSGMDPVARRQTWDIIRRAKRGRVVLLTTHFMDEANVLADRVCVMSRGRQQCSGTPIELKAKYGVGYNLIVTTDEQRAVVSILHGALTTNFEACLRPTALHGREMQFHLPMAASAAFPKMLKQLDAAFGEGGVDPSGDYVLSATTLEHVFLKLRELEGVAEMRSCRALSLTAAPCHARSSSSPPALPLGAAADCSASPETKDGMKEGEACDGVDGAGSLAPERTGAFRMRSTEFFRSFEDSESGEPDFGQGAVEELRAARLVLVLVRKRLLILSHDPGSLCLVAVVPILLVAFALLILTLQPELAGPSLLLSPSMFGSSDALLSSGSGPSNRTAAALFLNASLEHEDGVRYVPTGANTSTELSEELLASYYTHPVARRGAYGMDDQVPATVVVDWDYFVDNPLGVFQAVAFLDFFGVALGSGQDGDEVEVPESVQDELFDSISSDGAVASIIGNASSNATISVSVAVGDLVLDISEGFDGASLVFRDVHFNITVGNETTTVTYDNVTLDDARDDDALGKQTINTTVAAELSTLFNSSAPHSLPAFYAGSTSLYYQRCLRERAPDAPFRAFAVRNHPLPLTAQQSLERQVVLSIFGALFVIVGLCYAPASVVAFVVKERVTRSKHLQMLSGASPAAYWISTYLVDLCIYQVTTAGIMGCFALYSTTSAEIFWSAPASRVAVFLLVGGFGAGCIPLNYLLSSAFASPGAAQVNAMAFNVAVGFFVLLLLRMMEDIASARAVAAVAAPAFRAFPPFNLGEGLIAIVERHFQNFLDDEDVSALSWGVAGRPVFLNFALAAAYTALLLAVESDFSKRWRARTERLRVRLAERLYGPAGRAGPASPKGVDEDVAAEARRVEGLQDGELRVRVRAMRRCYAPPLPVLLKDLLVRGALGRTQAAAGDGGIKAAVRGVSWGVGPRECFGLLGTNGAGKSTTFGILTGALSCTSGSAHVCGDPVDDFGRLRRHIGYTPQEDPLIDVLSGYETLAFYGRLKGVREAAVDGVVQGLLQHLGLGSFADMPCGAYSGGNRRKLSLGIAVIGDPQVLFLDEPSSGMDPAAKRSMWDLILGLAKNRSVVLTSHSMEECEALCDRVAIMTQGKIRCIGTGTHLKQKFGETYSLTAKIRDGLQQPFERFVRRAFPGSRSVQTHGVHYEFTIPLAVGSPAHVFAELEAAKAGAGIVEYSLDQSATLEKIFVMIANENA